MLENILTTNQEEEKIRMERLNHAKLADHLIQSAEAGFSMKLEISEMIKATEGAITAINLRRISPCRGCRSCADYQLIIELLKAYDAEVRSLTEKKGKRDDLAAAEGILAELKNIMFYCSLDMSSDFSYRAKLPYELHTAREVTENQGEAERILYYQAVENQGF